MSRCVLDDEDNNIEVVIGWDPGSNSFFLRMFDNNLARIAVKQGKDDLAVEEAGLIIWTGGFDREYISSSDLDLLIGAIQPYATPHDPKQLHRELLKDKSNNDSDRTYTFFQGKLEDY